MKITIQEKKENPLLNRTELKGGIEFNDITPSNVKLAESLAKETKKDINLVVVKSIYTHFGQKLADFEAIVYDNKEAKDKIEMLTKHIKKKMEEDRKKENPDIILPESSLEIEKISLIKDLLPNYKFMVNEDHVIKFTENKRELYEYLSYAIPENIPEYYAPKNISEFRYFAEKLGNYFDAKIVKKNINNIY